MARLPTVDDLGARPLVGPVTQQRSVSGMDAVGRAMQGFGNTVAQVGDNIIEREATAAAKERDTYVGDQIRELMYNTETGFANQLGRNAVDQYSTFQERLDEIKNEATRGLNDYQASKLAASLEARMGRALEFGARHTADQRRTWINGASEARIVSAQQDAIADLGATNVAIATIEGEIADQVLRDGLSDEEGMVLMETRVGELVRAQVASIASRENPMAAMDYLEQYEGEIPSSLAAELRTRLEPEVKQYRGREIGRRVFDSTQSVAGGSSGAGVAEVVSAGAGWTEVRLADGTVERREGTRAWRNNNSGNIEYGEFARAHGAVGSDGRFAVFPTYEAGRAAKEALLFETGSYRNLTLAQAINRYAPPNENDTTGYYTQVAEAVGVDPNTPLQQLSPRQRGMMLDAMEVVEGYRAGDVEQTGEGLSLGTIMDIADPITRQSAFEEYNLASRIAGIEEANQRDMALSSAWRLVDEGGDLNALSFEEKEAIGLDGISALRAYSNGMRVETDPAFANELWEAYGSGELTEMNPAEWLGKLSRSDYDRFISLRGQDMRSATNAANAPEAVPDAIKPLTVSELMTRTGTALDAVGIRNSGDTAQQHAMFKTQLMDWALENPDAARDPVAVRNEINARLLNVSIDGGFFSRERTSAAFEIDYLGDVMDPSDDMTVSELFEAQIKIEGEVVPPELKQRVAASAAANLRRDPTPEEFMMALTRYYDANRRR